MAATAITTGKGCSTPNVKTSPEGSPPIARARSRSRQPPLCFTDEHVPGRDDPVNAARRSASAKAKDAAKTNAAGESVQSFSSLLAHLATLTRNTVVFAGGVRIDKLSRKQNADTTRARIACSGPLSSARGDVSSVQRATRLSALFGCARLSRATRARIRARRFSRSHVR